MDEKILLDRKLVLMNDGKYCLMLQVADPHQKDFLNGRYYQHKYWRAFTDKDNQMFFTMGELQHRIFRYIADNIREDGTTDLCHTRNRPFAMPNDLRRFFTDGLTSYATFEDFTNANNHFIVAYKEQNGDTVRFVVDTEDEMREKLDTFRAEHGESVYIGFEERNLNPLHLHGKFEHTFEELDRWYAIVAVADKGSEDERKIYYRRSSSKRLLFTDDVTEAKAFETREDAERCLAGFPELRDTTEMTVEEQTTPVQIKRREYIKNIAEME